MSGRRITIRPNTNRGSEPGSISTSAQPSRAKARRLHKLRIKSATIAAYSGVFLLVISLVAIGYQPPEKVNPSVANAVNASDITTHASVDQLLATNIGANLAAQANLPVAADIANTSVSLAAQNSLDQQNSNVISKPQIVQPTADNHTMRTYKANAGDTIPAVATQFNVTPETIRWANNLVSDALNPGQTLQIPPVNGVVYTVKAGDTPSSIASSFQANQEVIVAYNNLENQASLPVGQQIIVPSGVLPVDQRPGYVAPRTYTYSGGGGYGSVDVGLASASAGNQYAFGQCTWYAYNRRAQLGKPVGSYWGNASTWAMYARAAGYLVDGNPSVGAVQQNGGGYYGAGHVAVVESVDSGVSVTISEMNAYRGSPMGGYDRVDYYTMPWSDAASGYYNYIH